jgi:hypothetical protein
LLLVFGVEATGRAGVPVFRPPGRTVAGVVTGAGELPVAPVERPVVGVFPMVPLPAEFWVGVGAGDAHAGPTLRRPVCTPPVSKPPTTGTGVATSHMGPADAGWMTSANEATTKSRAALTPARFMLPACPLRPG